ncbi:MAG TPA: hemerythrin domain-containing protein [Acidimicrobiia bacterium]
MTTSTEPTDVTQLLESQHEQVKALFAKIGDGRGANAADDFCELRRMLAVHETAEEEVVYPALRKTGTDGERVADARLAEEAEAKEALQKLESIDPKDAAFAAQIQALGKAATAHAEAEEREVFPRIRAAASPETLATMGKALQRAEAAAPTHPHPHAPGSESAPGNLMAGPFLSIVDRVRDAMRSK